MRKRWWLLLVTLAVLLALAVPANAGILTAGNYTYLLYGQEVPLPVDILTLQGDTLVPTDLLAAVNLKPTQDGKAITLQRGPVSVQLQLGSPTAQVDGKVKLLGTGPLLASGRLFIPADVLPALGVQVTVDGKFVLITDYMPAAAVPSPQGDATYDQDYADQSVSATFRSGSAIGQLGVTMLSPALLSDARLPLDWGTRVKLLSMADTQTLLLVSVRNTSALATTLTVDPAKLLIVDNFGTQHDYLKTEVPVSGTVTSAVAPGATRSSVLAFSQVTGSFTVYYTDNSEALGRVKVK